MKSAIRKYNDLDSKMYDHIRIFVNKISMVKHVTGVA